MPVNVRPLRRLSPGLLVLGGRRRARRRPRGLAALRVPVGDRAPYGSEGRTGGANASTSPAAACSGATARPARRRSRRPCGSRPGRRPRAARGARRAMRNAVRGSALRESMGRRHTGRPLRRSPLRRETVRRGRLRAAMRGGPPRRTHAWWAPCGGAACRESARRRRLGKPWAGVAAENPRGGPASATRRGTEPVRACPRGAPCCAWGPGWWDVGHRGRRACGGRGLRRPVPRPPPRRPTVPVPAPGGYAVPLAASAPRPLVSSLSVDSPASASSSRNGPGDRLRVLHHRHVPRVRQRQQPRVAERRAPPARHPVATRAGPVHRRRAAWARAPVRPGATAHAARPGCTRSRCHGPSGPSRPRSTAVAAAAPSPRTAARKPSGETRPGSP